MDEKIIGTVYGRPNNRGYPLLFRNMFKGQMFGYEAQGLQISGGDD